MRLLLCLVTGLGGTVALVHALAIAPLIIVAPAAPGGGWDQTARTLQQVLAAVEPSAPVQVENVAGAAGTIGLARFVSAERGNPDALLVTGLVMLSGITTNRSPVTLRDTTPIARLTGEYEVIVVPARSPIGTLADLLAALRANPRAVTWGGGSAGGTDDILVRLIAEAVGVPPADVNYIAFAGGGAALAALLGAQVTAGVSGYGEFAGQIEAGTLRVLAIPSPERVAGIDAPTLREQGVDVELANWRGVLAPPGLSDAERDALTARIERLASSAEWRAALERFGWQDLLLTGPAFRQFLLAEQHRLDSVLARLERGGAAAPAVSPMAAPTAAAVMLVGLVTLLVVTRRAPAPDSDRITGDRTARAAWLAAGLALHAVTMTRVGFIPASAALFVGTAALFGSRRLARDAFVGLAVAVALFVAFTQGLGVSLPDDLLTRWWRR